jgi:prolyl 4-hydroxylase
MSEAPLADQAAIARIGAKVRARLSADPSVYRVPVERAELFTVADFVSPSECAHIIAMIDRVARPSTVFAGAGDPGQRTSYSGDADPADTFVRMIERRICDLMGMDENWGETFQGQRYQPGQEFQAHYDYFNTEAHYWPNEARRGGQRCWTAMLYLNEVEEGGATDFPMLGISIPPQAGLLLIWNNARPDGAPNPDSMHAGTPVISGVKYVITKWFRTRRWG